MQSKLKRVVASVLAVGTILSTSIPAMALGDEIVVESNIIQADKDYIEFKQSDSRWGNYVYDSNCTIGNSGCMITSIAMLMAYADSNLRYVDSFNPANLSKTLSFSNGAIHWESAENYNGTFKLVTSNLLDEKKGDLKDLIFEQLDNGNYVIIYANNVYEGSGAGHYSPVIGWDYEKDEPLVKDVANSNFTWERWEQCGVSQIVVYSSDVNPSYNVLEGGLGYEGMNTPEIIYHYFLLEDEPESVGEYIIEERLINYLAPIELEVVYEKSN